MLLFIYNLQESFSSPTMASNVLTLIKIWYRIFLVAILFIFITIIYSQRVSKYLNLTNIRSWRIDNSGQNISTRNLELNNQIEISNITNQTLTNYLLLDKQLSSPSKRNNEDVLLLRDKMLKYTRCLTENLTTLVGQNPDISFPAIEEGLRKKCLEQIYQARLEHVCQWPSSQLVGNLHVDMQTQSLESLKETELKFVLPGGSWHPKHCSPRQKVAIIIPFRKRESHLPIFLRQLHPILKRQELLYQIYVIEQADKYLFNRGKLMNVGFAEALKDKSFTCFVFHDVDLVPENDQNDYGCPTSPRHLSVAIDKFKYKLPYPNIFGGVEMFTREHFEKVNGFSNAYWGWGAEDDDLYRRVIENKLKVSRPSLKVGKYKMIMHAQSKDINPKKSKQLKKSKERMSSDGLSSLQYIVLKKDTMPLYTLIKVDLNMDGDTIY